jgi:hypothetical protein
VGLFADHLFISGSVGFGRNGPESIYIFGMQCRRVVRFTSVVFETVQFVVPPRLHELEVIQTGPLASRYRIGVSVYRPRGLGSLSSHIEGANGSVDHAGRDFWAANHQGNVSEFLVLGGAVSCDGPGVRAGVSHMVKQAGQFCIRGINLLVVVVQHGRGMRLADRSYGAQ